MKKYSLPLIATILLATSCMKETMSEGNIRNVNRAAMNRTWAPDSIQVNGIRINAKTTPAIADDRYVFWWGDGTGYSFPPAKNIGHGIRYQGKLAYWDTAYVPRVQRFDWTFNEGEEINSATIGGNRVTVDVTAWKMKITQTPEPGRAYEQWQTIWLSAVPDWSGMDGISK